MTLGTLRLVGKRRGFDIIRASADFFVGQCRGKYYAVSDDHGYPNGMVYLTQTAVMSAGCEWFDDVSTLLAAIDAWDGVTPPYKTLENACPN